MIWTTLASGLAVTTGAVVGIFNDIDGWLMGPEFLGALASAISTLLIALFNALFLGGTAVV